MDLSRNCKGFRSRESVQARVTESRAGDGCWPRYQAKSLACPICVFINLWWEGLASDREIYCCHQLVKPKTILAPPKRDSMSHFFPCERFRKRFHWAILLKIYRPLGLHPLTLYSHLLQKVEVSIWLVHQIVTLPL